MMKGKGSPILVMVGLVFLGGWSARAEPPVALSTDEITQEDGSDIQGSRPPFPEHARTHEQELQEDHEAVHQHDAGTHEHDADTHQHDSGTGEHMMGAEGMGSHSEDMVGPMGDGKVEDSRMPEAGAMGEPDGGMMSGNARGQAESMMGTAGGAVPGMHHDDRMMGGGTEGNHGGRMRGGH
jgi:hypothetical protein